MVRKTAAALLALSLAAPAVYAQEPVTPSITNIRASIEKIRFDQPPARNIAPQARFQQQRHPSVATKITVGFVGGFLGLFAGAAVGGAVQPPCHCDDPGLEGALIGAPIGAVLGAIAAIKLVSP